MAQPPFSITKPSRDNWLNMMIYGAYGSGKTRFISTVQDVPRMRNLLFLNIESGTMTLSDRQDIDQITVSDYRIFARVYEFLRLHCMLREKYNAGDEVSKAELIRMESNLKGIPAEEIEEPTIYRSVAIDSLTEVQKYCMYMLLGLQPGEAKLDLETPRPEWKEWGQSAEMIRLLIRSFRDLLMNTFFVCAEQFAEDETKRRFFAPALPGKLASESQGFLDVVGYLRTSLPKNTEEAPLRRLYLQPNASFNAKDRYHNNKLVSYIDADEDGYLRMQTFLDA